MSEKIFFTPQFSEQLKQLLSKDYSAFFVLADENTAALCYPQLIDILAKHHLIQIEHGEENKTLDTCNWIWEKLTEANADRNALLINLGGGMIGDIGGFAAGCYKRGIQFINIPTTLLAMVDASVGGKTGVDFMSYKNQIGLFNSPEAVFINTHFLETLPQRELTAGFAEVIKHYLIADKTAFQEIAATMPALKVDKKNSVLDWDKLVKTNVQIKTSIVENDPYEKNIRKALNFGHTVGHAVESCFLDFGDRKLLHGESVATGMIAEAFISRKLDLISENELLTITKVITHYFKLPVILPQQIERIMQLMKQDKKNYKGEIQFALLDGIGNFSPANIVEEKLIIQAIHYYNSAVQ